jgi:hypothetical protein
MAKFFWVNIAREEMINLDLATKISYDGRRCIWFCFGDDDSFHGVTFDTAEEANQRWAEMTDWIASWDRP